MRTPLNQFLKLHHPNHELDIAFFSNPDLPEVACSASSESYLVMVNREAAKTILLNIEGTTFRLTNAQASVLGSKLFEMASPDAS